MTDISINYLEDSPFSHKDVVELIHLAFKEREEQGLHFSCSNISSEAYAEDTRAGRTIVAFDQSSKELVGTSAIRVYDKIPRYGLFEYLAVRPEMARKGVATKLLQASIRYCIEKGADTVVSDTATSAKSSVKFHFKNGFKLDDIVSYPMTNYLSFVFRRNCHRSPEQVRLDQKTWRLRYWGAYLRLCLLYKKNGEPALCSRIYSTIKNHL